MKKQQQLQEFSKKQGYNAYNQQQIQIGTQILDPTLPSDLDFDKKLPHTHHQGEQAKFDNAIHLSQPYRKSSLKGVDLLQSYTVKGKSIFNMEPKYEEGKLVPFINEQLIQVKCYDEEEPSSGLKRFWEAVVGYKKRQISFFQGYFYMFERRPEGLFVSHVWKLVNLFKIFIDEEDSKIRFVLSQDQKLATKDLGVKNIKQVMEKLIDQMQKFGLKLQGQSNNL